MDKLEKVIKGFEHCKRESESIDDNPCNGCPYNYDGERGENVCLREQLMRDAIELLKDYAGLQERHRILVEKADDMYLMLKEQSQIVQCKDCKHGYKCEDSEFILCIHPFSDGHKHTEDWFCADGELK